MKVRVVTCAMRYGAAGCWITNNRRRACRNRRARYCTVARRCSTGLCPGAVVRSYAYVP
jgi:hypothetical protein